MYYGYRCIEWFGGDSPFVLNSLGCQPQAVWRLLLFLPLATIFHAGIATLLEFWKRYDLYRCELAELNHDSSNGSHGGGGDKEGEEGVVVDSMEAHAMLSKINIYPLAAVWLGFTWDLIPASTGSHFAQPASPFNHAHEHHRLLYFAGCLVVAVLLNGGINYAHGLYQIDEERAKMKKREAFRRSMAAYYDKAAASRYGGESLVPWYRRGAAALAREKQAHMGFAVDLNDEGERAERAERAGGERARDYPMEAGPIPTMGGAVKMV